MVTSARREAVECCDERGALGSVHITEHAGQQLASRVGDVGRDPRARHRQVETSDPTITFGRRPRDPAAFDELTDQFAHGRPRQADFAGQFVLHDPGSRGDLAQRVRLGDMERLPAWRLPRLQQTEGPHERDDSRLERGELLLEPNLGPRADSRSPGGAHASSAAAIAPVRVPGGTAHKLADV